MKQVTIVEKSPALAAAIKSVLTQSMRGASFNIVTKVSEAPAGSEIAHIGLPTYVPGTTGVKVHSIGTRMVPAEQKAAQWATIRNENSTIEELITEIGSPEEVLILPSRAVSAMKLAQSETRCEIMEAETEAEKLAAYKKGYELFRDFFNPKAIEA